MTLIAGVKVGNAGCIIGDFRLTNMNTGDQFDVAQKFIFLDNRLALYMAGSINTLGELKVILAQKMSNISHQDVDNEDGFLYKTLKEYYDQQDHNTQSIIIGVHLDIDSGTNKMFRMDALSDGQRRTYKIVPDTEFECEVIGSGVIITDPNRFQNRPLYPLSYVFKKSIDKGYNVRTATDAVEHEILKRLKELGPSIYQDAGITSVMNLTIIVGSALRVEGRTVEEFTVNQNGEQIISSFTYEKVQNTEVVLKDNITSETVNVYQSDEDFPYDKLENEKIFDPQKIERRVKRP